ncbi:squalene/phytoene synthase family protein [Paracoccus aerodenitrificans]|uniref:squalene/phytoene synthase family protein n=1 Tax=Paracoccus aerodenitrificans TaxID=3017781 RepID=UPI0022F0BCD2|nr:squalene/phytoene synthase family protein [Paracoccus aerodenitrificans]WBU65478.1 squalene/phytoene synthase family protein [Paracoccus aerodenitrificans]
MTPDSCAALLREHDPDRFASVAAARPRDRARLATLYAANLDIARAAVASAEPLISEMRLQFWADQLSAISRGEAPATHEIATPLAEAWGAEISPLSGLTEARRRDTNRQPFQDDADLFAYIDACDGTVMRLACIACGGAADDDLIRHQVLGSGLARWLTAYPRLRSLNLGLWPDDPSRLAALAQTGLRALDIAANFRPEPARELAPALYAGAAARAALTAIRDGNQPKISEFKSKRSHLSLGLLGRWQG